MGQCLKRVSQPAMHSHGKSRILPVGSEADESTPRCSDEGFGLPVIDDTALDVRDLELVLCSLQSGLQGHILLRGRSSTSESQTLSKSVAHNCPRRFFGWIAAAALVGPLCERVLKLTLEVMGCG